MIELVVALIALVFGAAFVIATFLFFVCIIPLILAFPVELLWNWVIVGLFHAPVITFWQSFGLLILLGIIRGVIVRARS